MSEEDNDKQHEATQKKLDDARKKGDFPKSTDLNTAASYAGLLIALLAVGGSTVNAMGAALQSLIEGANALSIQAFSAGHFSQMGDLLSTLLMALLPLFIIPAVAVLGSLFTQKSIVFAPSKLEFKLSRISPLSNMKQKFGRSGLFEFFKSFVKLSIYSFILGYYLNDQLPRIMSSIGTSHRLVVVELANLVIGLLSIVLVVAVTIGIIDFLWQKAEHARKNMMSRKELTDEMKNSDGDPAMKQQRRQKAVEIAMNQMLADVPDADVIIVNPTHYAVALKWDRMSLGAPLCVAKGVDELAAKIREIGTDNAIPIFSDPPTARALFATVEVGEEILPDHYQAVAAAIRFAESMAGKSK